MSLEIRIGGGREKVIRPQSIGQSLVLYIDDEG